MDIYGDLLDSVSVDALIRRGQAQPVPLGPLHLPSEYLEDRPDMLGMEVDNFLAGERNLQNSMRQSPVPNPPQPLVTDKSNAALSPWVPKGKATGAPIPMVGRDLSLQQITEILKQKESSGNYTALNREQAGNTASGAYQYTDATWNGYGGYKKAMLAPPHIQDRKFAEDIAARFKRFGGDPFKMMAAHYLPAAASDPRRWTQPYKLKSGKVVKPVASYLEYVTRGTPLEAAFHEYMARQQ